MKGSVATVGLGGRRSTDRVDLRAAPAQTGRPSDRRRESAAAAARPAAHERDRPSWPCPSAAETYSADCRDRRLTWPELCRAERRRCRRQVGTRRCRHRRRSAAVGPVRCRRHRCRARRAASGSWSRRRRPRPAPGPPARRPRERPGGRRGSCGGGSTKTLGSPPFRSRLTSLMIKTVKVKERLLAGRVSGRSACKWPPAVLRLCAGTSESC